MIAPTASASTRKPSWPRIVSTTSTPSAVGMSSASSCCRRNGYNRSDDIPAIVKAAKLVIDTRNSTKELREFKDKIIKLGAGNNPPPSAHRDEGHETTAQITAH